MAVLNTGVRLDLTKRLTSAPDWREASWLAWWRAGDSSLPQGRKVGAAGGRCGWWERSQRRRRGGHGVAPRRDCDACWLLCVPPQGRHPMSSVTRLLSLVAVWRIDIGEVRAEMVAATAMQVRGGGISRELGRSSSLREELGLSQREEVGWLAGASGRAAGPAGW